MAKRPISVVAFTPTIRVVPDAVVRPETIERTRETPRPFATALRAEAVRRQPRVHAALSALFGVALLVGLLPPSAHENLILNGSFENGLTDWQGNAGVRVIEAGLSATDGSHVLELDMPADDLVGFVTQKSDA